MLCNRTTAVMVGLLFLIATATYYAADMLIVGALANPAGLADAASSVNMLRTAALLAFITGIAAVAIACLMYPLLKRVHEPLALGYVAGRVLEFAAILQFLALPLLLAVLDGGGRLLAAGSLDAFAPRPLGAWLQAQYEVAFLLVWLLVAASGTIFAGLLLRSRLVPRWIAVLGCIGYPLMLAGTLGYLFGLVDFFGTPAGTLIAAPAGLFELILPIWLFVKGFNTAAIGVLPS